MGTEQGNKAMKGIFGLSLGWSVVISFIIGVLCTVLGFVGASPFDAFLGGLNLMIAFDDFGNWLALGDRQYLDSISFDLNIEELGVSNMDEWNALSAETRRVRLANYIEDNAYSTN